MTRQKHGSTFNHKVFRVRGMNLDDLTNPQWVTDEYGYEKAPPELDRLGAYCFGILALGDQHVILPLALRNYPGKGGMRGGNAWGGCVWVITEDGGATWRFRSGKTLAAKDLKAGRGVPIKDTTFAHTERGVFTMVNLVQMGPGYGTIFSNSNWPPASIPKP